MSNAIPPKRQLPPVASSSSVHVVITAMLGMIVTGLCCYVFYVFRTSGAKEQSLTDALKAIRAATEIVASIAEQGLPKIRGRIDELESRGRALERRVVAATTASVVPSMTATASPTPPPPQAAEADMLAARRAARAAQAS